MKYILLSGGSGKRLWPLSNDVRSKQFIKFFKDDDGEYESMVQNIYRHLCKFGNKEDIVIASSKRQISALHNQLGDDINVCMEPRRRDTFPAIALAAAFLKDVRSVGEDETVVVCPVDPFVNDDYFEAVKRLGETASSGTANLYLMGIKPTYPSEKYGYIIPETDETTSKVLEFKEKPNTADAQRYIDNGGLWNGGVFAFKLKYVLEKSRQILGFNDYKTLFEKYPDLESISFDYAVAEIESDICVSVFSGEWKDLGTWNTLTEAMNEDIGRAVKDADCNNVHVINELDIPILCMGLNNMVVAASHDGILVSDKHMSSFIKPYVDDMTDESRYSEKSWGSYKVIDVEEESITIKITLNPGHQMHYHSHERRNEVWNVIAGRGTAIIDGQNVPLKAGDILNIKAGIRHTVKAETELKIIETQLGKDINVNDKIKYDSIF